MNTALFIVIVVVIASAVKYLPWAIYGLEELGKLAEKNE